MSAKNNKVPKRKSGKTIKPRFKVTIIKARCKGCELCVQYCPTDTLEMSKELNEKGNHFAIIKNLNNCKGCEQCYKLCPDFAIYVEKLKGR